MKMTPLRALFGAIVIALAGAIAYAMSRGTPIEVVQVTEGPMLQTVVMSGRIVTVARTEIASQTTARIESILVREGDKVKTGQILVRLRDDEAGAALGQANAAVAQARARISEIQTIAGPVSRQQLAQAQAADMQTQAELARASDLLRQGFVSQSRLDDATRLARASAAALQAAKAQDQGNAHDGATTALAQAALDQALGAQRAAAIRLDQLSLRAPADAMVIARLADPGDTAQPGKTLLTLAGGAETRIQASVDEKNLKLLQLGQAATALADAYPARSFASQLTYIAPAVDAQRGTVDLRLTVSPPPDFLRTDMTVSVEIITGKRDKTLTLPSDALRRDASGKPFVWVNRDGRAQQVPIRLGLQGVGATEITEGLRAGDHVILPGSLVLDGDKVRETSIRAPKGNAPQVPGLSG